MARHLHPKARALHAFGFLFYKNARAPTTVLSCFCLLHCTKPSTQRNESALSAGIRIRTAPCSQHLTLPECCISYSEDVSVFDLSSFSRFASSVAFAVFLVRKPFSISANVHHRSFIAPSPIINLAPTCHSQVQALILSFCDLLIGVIASEGNSLTTANRHPAASLYVSSSGV